MQVDDQLILSFIDQLYVILYPLFIIALKISIA